MRIVINPFVRRQTTDSPFSHYAGDDFEKVRQLVEENFVLNSPGYRRGVLLVRVPAWGFFTGLIELQDGDSLVGEFKARQQGEEPRKHVYANQPRHQKAKAHRVDIVVYHRDVLAEDHSGSDPTADYEIVSINASPTDDEVPMTPETLIANHFHWDGGTATNMTDADFIAALKASAEFWRNRAMVK